MKKSILSLLLSFTLLAAFGQVADVNRQTKTPLTGSSAGNQSVRDYNLTAIKNLRIPVGSSFSIAGAKDSIGYLMYNTSIQKMGIYKGSGSWDTLSTSGTASHLLSLGTTAGLVFSDGFSRSSLGSSYMIMGAPTISFPDSNRIRLSGGTGNFDRAIVRNYTTAIHRWTQKVRFIPKNKNSTSLGLAIGVTSSTTSSRSLYAQFSCATATLVGNITLYGDGIYPSGVLASSASLAFSVNDILEGEITRNDLVVTATYRNITTGTSVTVSYTYSTASVAGMLLQNAGLPTLYTIGGTHDVTNWQFTSNENVANDLFIGDSNTSGYNTTSFANQYLNIAYPSRGYYSVTGGAGDKTADVVALLPEIISQAPSQTFLAVGINDFGSGVSSSVFTQNIKTILSTFKNTGRTAYVVSLPPYSSDVSPFNAILKTQAVAYGFAYIDIFTALKGSGTGLNPLYDSGDGLHWNNAGNVVVANTIAQYKKYYADLAPVGYIPKISSANTLSKSSIYQSADSVILEQPLKVEGNIKAIGDVVSDYPTGVAAFRSKYNGVDVGYYGGDFNAFGSGSITDMVTLVYGSNKYHIATNGVRRLTVAGSGNVGINITSPLYPFHVIGESYLGGNLNTDGVIFHRQSGAVKAASYFPNTSEWQIQTVSGYDLTWAPAAVERMRLNTSGNLLIGSTTDNGAKLQISGSVRATSNDGNANTLVRNTDLSSYATTSSLSGYVPYTGASTSVDLGTNDLTANTVLAINGSNYSQLSNAGVMSVNTTNATTLRPDYIYFRRIADLYGQKLFQNPAVLSAHDDIYLPAGGGTLARTSDIAAYVSSLRVTDATGIPYTKATLNSTYTSAPVGFKVVCTAIGIVYEKYNSTDWFSTTATILNTP